MMLHHVQLSCPPGGEEPVRAFWVDGLGLTEVAKPAELAGRGGAWFRAYDDRGGVAAEVHVGVEEGFVAARKAHPALLLDGETSLDDTARRIESLGHEVDHTERHTFPGYLRCHVRDPHGNRVELLAVPSGRSDRPSP